MFERRLPRRYRGREPNLTSWSELGVDLEIVRKVLAVMSHAFAWKEIDAQRLRPDDKLWPIYRSYYPQTHWWQRWKPDELEMETLLRDIQKLAPPGTVVDLHPDVTLAELVRRVAGPAREL